MGASRSRNRAGRIDRDDTRRRRSAKSHRRASRAGPCYSRGASKRDELPEGLTLASFRILSRLPRSHDIVGSPHRGRRDGSSFNCAAPPPAGSAALVTTSPPLLDLAVHTAAPP